MTATDQEHSEPSAQPVEQAGGIDSLTPAGAKPVASRRQLSLLAFVAVCGAGTGMAYFKAGPQSASAAMAGTPMVSNALGEFVVSDATSMKRIGQALSDTSLIADQVSGSAMLPQVPLTDLKTNPFRLHAETVEPSADSDDPDERVRDEQERQTALQAIQSLRLQSILRGDSHRACLINGSLFQEGQEISGFVIEEIAVNTVVVRRGIYRFELKLSK